MLAGLCAISVEHVEHTVKRVRQCQLEVRWMCSAALGQSATTGLGTGNDQVHVKSRSALLHVGNQVMADVLVQNAMQRGGLCKFVPHAFGVGLESSLQAMLRMFFGSSTLVHRTYALRSRPGFPKSLLAISHFPFPPLSHHPTPFDRHRCHAA